MSKLIILCVDDEKMVLETLKRQLRRAFRDAYSYEVAQDADEALELIEELNKAAMLIIIIVSDWLMPGMRGDEFLIKVHQQFPNIIKILLIGQADEAAIERARLEANLYCCLHKPWSQEELVATIQSALAKL
ncbi:response regulator [Allocoleopsis sp.]|uniref:response regulator n=1 Tax=Allocoleopsis sp. TaxID=3088169 RepID=UPI002FD477AA